MSRQIEGRIWVLGDDVDTDAIAPQRYCFLPTAEERSKHCLEFLCPEFSKNAKEGDIIVAGKNFGCGSSREYAPAFLQGCGVKCIVAKSFARIFFRNALNNGFLLIETDKIQEYCNTGNKLKINVNESIEVAGHTIPIQNTLPPNLLEIYEAGGLVNYNILKNKELEE